MSDLLMSKLKEEEQKILQAVREEHPERVTRPEVVDPDIILGRIGITYLRPERPRGYVKLYPQDFLVEEIGNDGNVIPLVKKIDFQDAEDHRTLWADLIKVNQSHPHALADLYQLFGLEAGKIGVAGIKDAMAITAQRVSLRGVSREQAEKLEHPRMMLRPLRYGSGAIQPGELKGNRFTIVVRTEHDDDIAPLLEPIQQKGYPNFFGKQRFGPQLLAHRLGQKLLQDDVEGAIKLFLGEPGLFDMPLFRDIHVALRDAYGDWDQMLALTENFPYTFQKEIKVIQALKQDSYHPRQALLPIQDQARIWIYAYGSWVVNRYISSVMEQGSVVPQEIPSGLMETGPAEPYHGIMEKDGTLNYLQALRRYPYVQAAKRGMPGMIIPQELIWNNIPQGWMIRFSLPPHTYPLALLSHPFRLFEWLPVPKWVRGEMVDALAEMNDGSIMPIYERFKDFMSRRDTLPPEEGKEEESASE